jgi:hypothetical protein
LATVFELLQKIVVRHRFLTPPSLQIREVRHIFFEGDPHGIVDQIRDTSVGLERFEPECPVEILLQVNRGSFHVVDDSGITL